ncbi:hypothetical protein SESBI_18705 [Sesbania bispinosa]|nr:hypothetical protein SESBI_18705 [Sesbania bispinosa]
MGNWFGKERSSRDRGRDEGVTIKVRMTKGQLKDLVGKVDVSNGNSELGRLIVQECSKGRLHARVAAADSMLWGLRPIQEHSEE